MFTKNPVKATELQMLIDETTLALKTLDPSDKQFAQITQQLETLYKLRKEDTPSRFSKDQMLVVGGNLAGIFLILHFERFGVVASKALSFAMKLK